MRAHWGVDDPAKATGTEAEIDASFEEAYSLLRQRIEAFLALPLDELQHDTKQFEEQLKRIGTIGKT